MTMKSLSRRKRSVIAFVSVAFWMCAPIDVKSAEMIFGDQFDYLETIAANEEFIYFCNIVLSARDHGRYETEFTSIQKSTAKSGGYLAYLIRALGGESQADVNWKRALRSISAGRARASMIPCDLQTILDKKIESTTIANLLASRLNEKYSSSNQNNKDKPISSRSDVRVPSPGRAESVPEKPSTSHWGDARIDDRAMEEVSVDVREKVARGALEVLKSGRLKTVVVAGVSPSHPDRFCVGDVAWACSIWFSIDANGTVIPRSGP